MALGFTIFMLSREYKITVLASFYKMRFLLLLCLQISKKKITSNKKFQVFDKIDFTEI